jgi:NADH-quinone oxidoreductase B subunit
MVLRIILTRFKVGNRTTTYPKPGSDVPEGPYQNVALDPSQLTDPAGAAALCPNGSLRNEPNAFHVDHGACLACGACSRAYPQAFQLTREFETAARSRRDLIDTVRFHGDPSHEADGVPTTPQQLEATKAKLRDEIHRIFGRSLHVREVAAGGCNGCEVEAVNLSNPYYDVERLGVHFVASPRHADMLLVTGPVTWHMADPLRVAYDAMPEPRLVVAAGACGIHGGPFVDSYAVTNGVDQVLPVDVYIPGCPPRPEALIHGILLAIGKAEQKLKHRELEPGRRSA